MTVFLFFYTLKLVIQLFDILFTDTDPRVGHGYLQDHIARLLRYLLMLHFEGNAALFRIFNRIRQKVHYYLLYTLSVTEKTPRCFGIKIEDDL
jgi:hypothetical protein